MDVMESLEIWWELNTPLESMRIFGLRASRFHMLMNQTRNVMAPSWFDLEPKIHYLNSFWPRFIDHPGTKMSAVRATNNSFSLLHKNGCRCEESSTTN